MKKIYSIIIFIAILFMGASPLYADVGMPTEVLYTVCIDVQGADYYDDYRDGDIPTGRLPGGQKFYVWADHMEGYYEGTTDVSLGADQYDDFIYIRESDTCPPGENISPNIGQSSGETIHAVTTDKLNMRCGPGVGFNGIYVLDKGTKLDYEYTYDTDSTWVYANANGKNGWVNSAYLNRVEETTVQKSMDGTDVYEGNERSGTNRAFVIGIVLICIGAAVIIAVLAVSLLNRTRAGRSQKKSSGNNFCRECGAQIPEGSRFCEKCGTPVIAPEKESRKNVL